MVMTEPSIPDWINAIAAATGALAIVAGLFGAKNSIEESRNTARELRKSEVAEELIAIAFNVEDALKDIRNPFSSIPQEKLKDNRYPYQRRYERIVIYNELFRSLRDAQIRVRAVVNDPKVDEAVEVLFSARSSVAVAVEILADYADDHSTELSDDEKNHMKSLKKDMYGSFSKRDELGSEITSAIACIEERLGPVARLNS
ncbi:MAG: hypothetical protein ABJN34_08715 [Litoreibacter sp.]|uniref:hypothetical protein n=1 Tax=Litoreibacter sp. TaxID=1969459 RepID=UPI0032996A2A